MTRSSHALLAVALFASAFFAQAQTQPSQPTTLSAMVEHEISAIEKQVVGGGGHAGEQIQLHSRELDHSWR